MTTKRHRLPKPGNRERLKATVWGALTTASRLSADESATTDERIRACHAVASLSGSYAKLLDGDGDAGAPLRVEIVRRIVNGPDRPV